MYFVYGKIPMFCCTPNPHKRTTKAIDEKPKNLKPQVSCEHIYLIFLNEQFFNISLEWHEQLYLPYYSLRRRSCLYANTFQFSKYFGDIMLRFFQSQYSFGSRKLLEPSRCVCSMVHVGKCEII